MAFFCILGHERGLVLCRIFGVAAYVHAAIVQCGESECGPFVAGPDALNPAARILGVVVGGRLGDHALPARAEIRRTEQRPPVQVDGALRAFEIPAGAHHLCDCGCYGAD